MEVWERFQKNCGSNREFFFLRQCGFHQCGLSSGRSVIGVVCHQDGLSSVVCHRGGLSSGWSVVRVVCHRGGLSLWWSLAGMVCHLDILSSGWCHLGFHCTISHTRSHNDLTLISWSCFALMYHFQGVGNWFCWSSWRNWWMCIFCWCIWFLTRTSDFMHNDVECSLHFVC